MKVWVDHDGGVDDFLATMIASKAGELLGVSVLDGDCFIDAAVECTARMLAGMGYTADKVVVAGSSLPGVNPFPKKWRGHAHNCADFPFLNTPAIDAESARMISNEKGEEVLARHLEQATEPVTIVATGPLSNIAWLLDNRPDAVKNIRNVLIMGGAVNVAGNVHNMEGHDGTAEWNLFWDPPAAKKVFDSALSLVVFPLDATNDVPVNHRFVRRLGPASTTSFCSLFAGTAWSLCTAMPHTHGYEYYAWDALTAAYIIDPTFYETERMHLAVIPSGPSQGRTVVDATHPRTCLVVTKVDAEAFYSLVVRVLA